MPEPATPTRAIELQAVHHAMIDLCLSDHPKECGVPRFFFHVIEGDSKILVRDSEGMRFASSHEAKREAVGLARDFARHDLAAIQAWKVVVVDEAGRAVVTVPLSNVRPRKLEAMVNFFRHIVWCETSVRAPILAALLMATMLAVIVQTAIKTVLVTEPSGNYLAASSSTEDALVAVRFIPSASVADVTKFLEEYNGTIVEGPRPAGFYRLRIGSTQLSREELATIVGRMSHESTVDMVAAVQ
jgi:hypothetical protein